MQANTMNLFGISFILVSCLSSLCVEPALANWPVFSIEKGETAVVPCVPKGDETAYFWSKGEDFATSQSVASRVLGIPSSDSEKYLVNEDGSLVIYNVTLAEGGRYHCRIVSENTNCRGAVSIEVTVNDFTFGIEQCEPSESCTLQVEPSKETKLTCTAKGGPSSLSLKWYNGSKEINSVSNEPPLNEESSTISETITVLNEFGLPLTCEAFDSKDGQTCGRFAHVRLNRTDTAKQQAVAVKSSAIWIIAVVLLTVVIVFLTICLYGIWKKYTVKSQMLDETETLLEEKEEDINKAKREFTEKEEALMESEKKLMSTQAKLNQATDSSQNTATELKKVKDDLDEKKTALTNKTEECKMVNSKLTEKDQLLKNKTEECKMVNSKLTEKDQLLKKKTEEFKMVNSKLNEKDQLLKKKTEEFKMVNNKLNEKDQLLKNKTEECKMVNSKLTEKDQLLKERGKELESTPAKLKQATDSSQERGKELESTPAKLKQATDSSQGDEEGQQVRTPPE